MFILIIILTIDIILFSTDEEFREQRAYLRQSQHAISNLSLEITIQKPQGSMLSEFLLKQNYKAERCQRKDSTAAAAAAKSLQSCPTRCDPVDGSPPGSPIPGILQARTLEWVAISFSNA